MGVCGRHGGRTDNAHADIYTYGYIKLILTLFDAQTKSDENKKKFGCVVSEVSAFTFVRF